MAMNEENRHIDPEPLIHRYLTGEAEQDEIRQLEDWVMSDEVNRHAFRKYRESWNLSLLRRQDKIDVEKAWQTVEAGISKEKSSGLRSRLRAIPASGWLRYAAVLAVFLAAFIWMYQSLIQDDVSDLRTENLVLINQLPDGSTVSLNRNASIRFRNERIRKVQLTGDAFFEVKKDAERPFIVEAGSLHVEVLGTSFYVDARQQEERIEVVVETGLVKVRSQKDSLLVEGGQRVVFDARQQSLDLLGTRDVNYLSWKTRNLVFRDESLLEVISRVNELYQVDIRLDDPGLASCRITVSFFQQELDSVLEIIARTLDLTIERKDERIILTGSPCQ